MKGVFVTGTDTGVGKTVVTAGILCALRARGIDAVPMKPVQTGCIRSRLEWLAPDLEFCLAMAGVTPAAEEKAWMAPRRFEPACSPHLAAARAGTRISLPDLVEAYRHLGRRHAFILVEGAGGILVPLNEREFTLDLMTALRLPVLLVARAGLGTLNHTLLSLRALRDAGLEVHGVVLASTQAGTWGMVEEDNARTIVERGDVSVLARLPFLESLAGGSVSAAEFRSLIVPVFSPLADAL